MASVKQITLRNPSPELTRRLRSLSQARGESLNTTILRLLQEAVGIDERRQRLARYNTWSAEELDEFRAVHRAQRTIDPEMWE
jgi:hypothetical protein